MKTKLTTPRTLLALFFLAFITLFVFMPRKQRIAVKFDYDFRLSPACSLMRTKNCIKQFNVYEMNAEGRTKLFSIPIPGGGVDFVKGISGTSPPIVLPAGELIVAVTAESADGLESDPGECTMRIQKVKR
jgi:hypothetical protein